MFQPNTTCITLAIANMFTPDIKIVMNPNETALSPLAAFP